MGIKNMFAWFFVAASFVLSLHGFAYCACHLSVGPTSGFESSYGTARGFYTETPTGTVAYMPHVRSKADANFAYEFYVFGDERRLYTIPCDGPYWLVVNHRGETDERSQFVGVKIIYLYNDGESSGWLSLYRNGGWVDSAACDKDYDFYNPFQNDNYRSKSADFMRWHDKEDVGVNCSVKELDKIAGGKWHGLPAKGSDQDSFKLKYPIGMQDDGKDIEFIKSVLKGMSTDNCNVAFRLLKFDVTQKESSNKRLAFDVDRRGSDAIFIKFFSPYGDKFSKKYIIKFR